MSTVLVQGSGNVQQAKAEDPRTPAPVTNSAASAVQAVPKSVAPPKTAVTTSTGSRSEPISEPPVTDQVDPNAGFSLSCSTDGLIVCVVKSLNGFSGVVDLACESPYENLPCSFVPPSITVPSGGSASSLYNNPPGLKVFPGRYELLAVATSGESKATAPVVLEVPVPDEFVNITCSNQFKIALEDVIDVPAGQYGEVGCTANSSYGVEVSVTITCPPVAGMTCIAPNPVVIPPFGATEIGMGVDVPAGTPAGGYRFHMAHDKKLPTMAIPTWFLIEVVD